MPGALPSPIADNASYAAEADIEAAVDRAPPATALSATSVPAISASNTETESSSKASTAEARLLPPNVQEIKGNRKLK